MQRINAKKSPVGRIAQLLAGALLILALVTRAAEPGSSEPSIPSAQEILARLNRSHPRLLASSNDFVQLKARIGTNSQLRSWQAALDKQAREILSAAPSRYEIPDGLRLLETSRRVLNRVYTLAFLYQLEGEQKY